MIEHLSKNRTWIIIAIAEIYTGIVIIFRNQALDINLPHVLSYFDDMPVGLVYITIGLLMLVNFVWDFWWYNIRLILVIASEMMFVLLFTSYLANDIVRGSGPSFFTGYALIFAIDVLWCAYLEPPYKMWKGGKSG